ncbi:phBC6A51 family helix-turn-helix protein [Mechercharimyces sp. CAU 1602]|uniref:phBC6A51 family helix-turn-helix protein n=1 Tax=Mechercharimyces sp. CAU 1602 TaxID=2973933 RepID=UPI002162A0CD|nr:phBC6A51 family helix-turn-helix protein [Mechercharimyces sp. CAU 1602]MCS1350303.1 phBC6A51 family helix-turn-helix protein [Mechercharimyces sp. CAU 1602]
MALKRLEAKHYKALSYLIQPDNGGLSLEEIAEECGVTRKTLWEWRNDDTFDREFKKQMRRLVGDRAPELLEAGITQALSGSGKHLELMLKSIGGILTDEVEISQNVNSNVSHNVDDIKARLKRYKKRKGDEGGDDAEESETETEVYEEEETRDSEEDRYIQDKDIDIDDFEDGEWA